MKNNDLIKKNLLKTIDELYKEYNLPTMNISDKEWNSLIDILDVHFTVHQIKNDLEHAINIILRRAIYFSQRIGAKEVSFEHLSKALDDLVAFRIYDDEIVAIREEFEERVKGHSLKK